MAGDALVPSDPVEEPDGRQGQRAAAEQAIGLPGRPGAGADQVVVAGSADDLDLVTVDGDERLAERGRETDVAEDAVALVRDDGALDALAVVELERSGGDGWIGDRGHELLGRRGVGTGCVGEVAADRVRDCVAVVSRRGRAAAGGHQTGREQDGAPQGPNAVAGHWISFGFWLSATAWTSRS